MGEFQKRVLAPMVLPLGAAAFIGVLVLAFSRILLAVPEVGSTTLATLVAMEILGVGAVLSAGKRMKASQRALLLATGLGLIGGGAASASIGIRTIEPGGIRLAISAKGIAFSTNLIQIPAAAEVELTFRNNDAGIPHNVSVYTDETASQGVAVDPDPFPGPASRTYALDLEPGSYFFRCDVHPVMAGRIVAAEGAEPNSSPSPAGSPSPTASPPASPTAPPPATVSPGASTRTSIVGKDLAFDRSELELAADVPVTISFDNQDPGVPHNVAIYIDSTAATPVFREDPFNGPDQVDYRFTAPAAGSYFFRCDVHPGTMKGTAVFT